MIKEMLHKQVVTVWCNLHLVHLTLNHPPPTHPPTTTTFHSFSQPFYSLSVSIRRASQASLQLALQADLCHNKTSRTLSVSAYTHSRKHTKTRRPTATNAAGMPAGARKRASKNTKWWPCSSFSCQVKLKSSPTLPLALHFVLVWPF